MAVKVLISHAHDEKELALAWKNVIERTSQGAVEVWLSSDSNPEGGMELGQGWRETVYERLSNADFVIAVLTPHSLGRPWILWECGAASGVDKERGIVPIVHKMSPSDLTGPLSSYQAYAGDDPAKTKEVCERFARKAGLQPQPEFWQPFLDQYTQAVESFAPAKAYSDRVFALWTNRFAELVNAGRSHELSHLVDQFYLAVGGRQPLDVMIHELLSSWFLNNRQFDRALEEVDFALSLLPDDTALVHRKGLILIGEKNYGDVEALLEQTFERHQQTKDWPELAGLEGRLYRELNDVENKPEYLTRAISAYKRAFDADPTQDYPGSQAIALAARAGDQQTVEELMPRVLALCEGRSARPDASYWSDFSLGELLVIKDDLEVALVAYRRGLERQPPPSPRDVDSARNGLLHTAAAVGRDVEGILALFPAEDR